MKALVEQGHGPAFDARAGFFFTDEAPHLASE
jgi:hypothetical protein